MIISYLALGSNLGNKEENIQNAVLAISSIGEIIRYSSLYETEPWGFSDKNFFLNMVLSINTELNPNSLLNEINKIEILLGRKRVKEQWVARIIDIDILFYDNQIINQPNLIIPHPQLINRQFVLKPLIEIAPEFVHPVYQKSISILQKECKDICEVKWVKHFQY